MRFFRPRAEAGLPETSLVVFVGSAADADTIDVASGPFSPRVGPRGGRVKPMASVHLQHYRDSLEHLSALYTVMTGRPASEVLSEIRRDGPGVLAKLSDGFVETLAPIGPSQREGQDLWATYEEIAATWHKAVRWSPNMQLGGLTMRIFDYSYACRQGLEKGLPVWAWHGRALPVYVIAHGVGQESYEAYRRQKGKR